jgi:SAM-dependent methyltransferase
MGHIFNYNEAVAYEHWQGSDEQRLFIQLQNTLMVGMLRPSPGESVLDIGCGPGRAMASLLERDLKVTGIDPSPYMIDISRDRLLHRADLHIGVAEDLPFDDNAYNYTLLINTLEFVSHPRKALEEACRVTKDRMFIGFLNRMTLKSIYHHTGGWEIDSVYRHARFFTLWEVKDMISCILGDVPITWRTVSFFSSTGGGFTRHLERLPLLQRFPFGMFIGMVVEPIPRFRARPLSMELSHHHCHSPGPAAG